MDTRLNNFPVHLDPMPRVCTYTAHFIEFIIVPSPMSETPISLIEIEYFSFCFR